MTKFKVGEIFNGKYVPAPRPKDRQWPLGKVITIVDKNHKPVARYVVEQSDEYTNSGKIIEVME